MVSAPYAHLKRFRFTGLVELTFRDYNVESSYYGRSRESGSTSFEQRYTLGMRGYVYHPKFISFLTRVSFRKLDADHDDNGEHDADDINYSFSVNVLPAGPVSLDVYGLKTDSNVEGWGTAPYDITSTFYGARLRFSGRKYPSMRLEYNHWDYVIEREKGYRIYDFYDYYYGEEEGIVLKKVRIKEKTDVDRLSLNVNGFLKSISTRYNMTADISDYVSPYRDYTGVHVTANTYTTIKKESSLSTIFQYSDIDITKLTVFSANLNILPKSRLQHGYGYEFLTYETDGEKTEAHTVSNYLHYRFSRTIFGTTHLRYRFGKRDGIREDSYDIDVGLNYGKTIKEYDFASYYKFALSKDERYGEYDFMGNSLGIGVATRKFRVGTIYANYDISLRTFDFSYYTFGDTDSSTTENIDSLEHRIRAGINGLGPGRAYWNVEAEARIFDSDTKNDGFGFWIGEEQWAESIRHYTFTGDIGYPIKQRGIATFKASYTTGTTNSENVERYYYEGRINYHILRNLNFLAWWREESRNKGWWTGRPTVQKRDYGWKNKEYQLELRYLLRRITLSLEYNVYKLEEGPTNSEYKRLYMKLTKPF